MKILTISESPYLLTRNGRINRDLMLSLTAEGHQVDGLVFSHDVSYFLSTEMGEHFFDHEQQRISRLHPFLGDKGVLSKFAYELMKRVQPQLVITIGAAHQTSDIWAIKASLPHLFKWIAVLPEGSPVVNEGYMEQIGSADLVIATSEMGRKAVANLCAVPCEYVPYGPNLSVFKPIANALPEEFGVVAVGKNSQMTNLPAFIRAISKCEGLSGYIHTNIDDIGDYDIRGLLRRYKCDDRVAYTGKFVSIREGVTDDYLNDLYNKSHVFVDCSMQSATALSMLEAMATGCIPVGLDFGAVGEVIRRMPEEYRFVIPHNVFVGPREEEYAIVAEEALVATFKALRSKCKAPEWLGEARQKACFVAEIFSKDVFVKRLNTVVESIVTEEHALVVDIL